MEERTSDPPVASNQTQPAKKTRKEPNPFSFFNFVTTKQEPPLTAAPAAAAATATTKKKVLPSSKKKATARTTSSAASQQHAAESLFDLGEEPLKEDVLPLPIPSKKVLPRKSVEDLPLFEEEEVISVEEEDEVAVGDDKAVKQPGPTDNPFSFKAFTQKRTSQQRKKPHTSGTLGLSPELLTSLPSLDDGVEEEGDGEEEYEEKNVFQVNDDQDGLEEKTISEDEQEEEGKIDVNKKVKEVNPFSFKVFTHKRQKQQKPEKEEVGKKVVPAPATATATAVVVDVPELDELSTIAAKGTARTVGTSNSNGTEGMEANSRANSVAEKKARDLQRRLDVMEKRLRLEEEKNKVTEKRALRAEKALAALRVKEKEETKQLHDIVKQVEANLITATARAEKAEARIVQLEKENEELLAAANSSNAASRRTGSVVGEGELWEDELKQYVHRTAKEATDELFKAASEAEDGIKKLMGGANALRSIAQLLQNLERFSIVTTEEK
ncbi:Serologically defined colon cancer antigen 3 [Balamuthia mandrillaris]